MAIFCSSRECSTSHCCRGRIIKIKSANFQTVALVRLTRIHLHIHLCTDLTAYLFIYFLSRFSTLFFLKRGVQYIIMTRALSCAMCRIHERGGPSNKVIHVLTTVLCLVGMVEFTRVVWTLAYPNWPTFLTKKVD